MTDGQFGHGWESESEELQRRASNVIGLAIGEDAEVDSLQRVSSSVAHITSRDPALIRETFAWVGDVIRVSAIGGEGRIYPAPPRSISHLPGTQAKPGSRRWSDDQTLSSEELQSFREEEARRRQEEQKRRQEAIERREEVARRRHEDEQRAQRRMERIRSMITDEVGSQVAETLESKPSLSQSAPQRLASQVREFCRAEVEALNTDEPPTTVRSVVSRCGLNHGCSCWYRWRRWISPGFA